MIYSILELQLRATLAYVTANGRLPRDPRA
jgi:hypothetical protein